MGKGFAIKFLRDGYVGSVPADISRAEVADAVMHLEYKYGIACCVIVAPDRSV